MDGPHPTTLHTPTEPNQERTGLARLRRLFWWSSVGLVYGVGGTLAVAIAVAGQLDTPTVVAAVGVGVGAGVAGRLLDRRFGRIADPGDPERPPGLMFLGTVSALATVAAAQWPTDPPTWSIVPGMVTGGIAVSVPRRYRTMAVGCGAVVAAATAVVARYLRSGSLDVPDLVVNAVLVGAIALALISTLWSWEVVERLDRARHLEARLAVADERLRFAADLHDVQGHHLHVIALESELATRLAERDPGAARATMQQVHDHARAALDETRDLVQGYRQTSLGAELANATRVLAAAGIDGRLSHGTEEAADHVPDAGRHLLGLVVREATTNVLRHSRAGIARLDLEVDPDGARLQIRNDGAAPATEGTGTGLGTLASRLDSVGGTLDWTRNDDWFTVTARVPAVGRQAV